MGNSTKCFIKYTALFFSFFILCARTSSAQSGPATGHEALRGEVNFTDLANHELLYPPAATIRQPENEDDEVEPVRPVITDPSFIHTLATPPPTFGGLFLALSPAPADTFESTLSVGTNIPPDTHGGVDATYCVTAINQGIHIQTRAGANVSSVSLDGFWAPVLPTGSSFDPRVHYDQGSGRWIMVSVAGANNTTTNTCVLIGVSKTGDPTGAWWLYNVPAYTAGGYWLDFPDCGFNSKWITVTGNLFQDASGPGYLGCKVFIFNKANLMSGAGAPFTTFTQASSECITPAITYDATQQSLFAVEKYNGDAAQVQVWKITGAVGSESMTAVGLASAGAALKWQSQSFTFSGTGGADFAPQAGTANLVQTNDDRITQVVFMNNHLWFAHNVFLPYSTTTNPTRCSVQWWETDTLAAPIQVGRIDDATGANFYSFPSIAVNTNNDALLGFSHFSTTTYPTASYALHANTDASGTMESLVDFRHGTASYYQTFSGTRNRWGDYSATVIDPVNNIDFWTIQEASATPANTWDTWWAYVKPCNLPAATVTAGGPTTFCAGGSVTLSTITGAGYSYVWKLAGSPIAGATNATYSATASGSYTVVVSLSTCTSTSTATVVTVNPAPTAAISPSGPIGLCTGGSALLTAVGSGTYQWQTGGSPIPGATNSTYTATASGNYTVIITSSGCSTTSAVVVVTVGSGPVATITPSGPTSFCSPGSVTLNASTGAGYTYQWQAAGSPISGATNSSYTTSVSGNFTVVITATSGGGCSTTSSVTTVTAYTPPAPITGTLTVCAGATTPLGETSGGGVWSSSALGVATVSASGVVSGVSAGTSTIAYTIGGICTASVVVTVNAVSAGTVSGPAIICIGGSVTFTDVATGGVWSSSNSHASVGSSSGVVTGVSAGSVIISYTITNPCGTAVASETISVNGTPVTVAPITGTLTICSGLTSTLSDATPGGTWVSSNPLVATITSSGVVTAVAPGTTVISYNVTSAGGCVSSASATFTVSSPLAAVITPAGPTTFCTGGFVLLNAPTGIGYTYQWSRGGAPIPGATSSFYSANTSGNYTVTITISGGCVATSSIVTVTVTAGSIVVPSVNIIGTPGPILCLVTSPDNFTAVPTNGGTPSYQWSVNGVPVSSTNTYSYTPAAGDVLTVLMTSTAACAFPTTVSKTDTIIISPLQTPSVSMTVSPANPVCPTTTVHFTALPTYGGLAPSYRWTRNGSLVDTSATYSLAAPANGDTVVCTMISNYPCLLSGAPVKTSTYHLSVETPPANTLYLYAPDTVLYPGQTATFVSTPAGGGPTPTYQWYIGTTPVPGATNAMFVTISLTNGDTVYCVETSSDPCATPHIAKSRIVIVSVAPSSVKQVVASNNNFTLAPNPNMGEFTIRGTLGNPAESKVNIVITNLVGQTILRKTAKINNGAINERIVLDKTIPNGTYTVTVISSDSYAIFHVVVNQ